MSCPMRSSSTRRLCRALLLICAALAANGYGADAGPQADFALPPPVPAKDYAPYPQPGTGYVTDLAGLLTWEEEERIETWLWQVEYRSQVEIIVVTIDSIADFPGSANRSIDSFATGLFDAYGIGNLPKNDGVMLLVARQDRQAKIELGTDWGTAMDGSAQEILSTTILPAFRSDNYAAGIIDGTEAIIVEFADMRVGFPWYMVWLGIGGVVSVLVGISLILSGRRGWGFVVIGLALIVLLWLIFLAVRFIQCMPISPSSDWDAGGEGGFGGGFSGGGGATGDW